MTASKTSLAIAALSLSLLTACGVPHVGLTSASGAMMQAHGLKASVLKAQAVPQAIVNATLAPAQAAADEASKRRQIDFFNLHPNPVGMQIQVGDETAYVLSYLGTSKDRTDLNIELRALYASGHADFAFNYSGEVTQSAGLMPHPTVTPKASGPVSFELLQGLPGNGVADAYGAFLDHMADQLQQRYQARPFTFDDGPLVFALKRGDEPVSFVFLDQGNQLVLGDRKYADVQNVTLFDTEGTLKAAYTLVGFNDKTPTSTTPPKYSYSQYSGLGTVVQFGDL